MASILCIGPRGARSWQTRQRMPQLNQALPKAEPTAQHAQGCLHTVAKACTAPQLFRL